MEFKAKTEIVNIGDHTLTIIELSAKQRSQMMKLYKSENAGPIDIQAYIIKAGCTECADMNIDEILDMPGTIVGELSDEILLISGLTENAEEEAEKNS